MQDENLPDLFPVCQELRARVGTDPVLAAQWRGLVVALREVCAARLSRLPFAAECSGCVRRDNPPGVNERL